MCVLHQRCSQSGSFSQDTQTFSHFNIRMNRLNLFLQNKLLAWLHPANARLCTGRIQILLQQIGQLVASLREHQCSSSFPWWIYEMNTIQPILQICALEAAGVFPSGHLERQATIHTSIHLPTTEFEFPIHFHVHDFGLWEEARERGENPHRWREQTRSKLVTFSWWCDNADDCTSLPPRMGGSILCVYQQFLYLSVAHPPLPSAVDSPEYVLQ